MRKIAVFTSTRADYGLLKGVLRQIESLSGLQLQLIVSGTHLSADFGMTVNAIKDDGFTPDESIEMILTDDTPQGICKSMGLAIMGFGEALARITPHILIILGDRYEALCAASAAQVCRVPIAHLYGGEQTEGLIDEAFRHSITKMSHLHFTSCEKYRRRVIQLGEAPDRVFNVGSLGIENIARTPLIGRTELAEVIGIKLKKPYFLVTFHPVTLEDSTSEEQFRSLLKALDAFPEYDILFTKANADTSGRVINRLIDDYAKALPEHRISAISLGMRLYLSAMKYASAVIGNSSSGIIEAPSFKIPTINIGDRQRGRVQAESILNCEPQAAAIETAIRLGLSLNFQHKLKSVCNPYEKADTASTIVSTIASTSLDGLLKKKFFDIPIDCRI